jgi:hypothetical protein
MVAESEIVQSGVPNPPLPGDVLVPPEFGSLRAVLPA